MRPTVPNPEGNGHPDDAPDRDFIIGEAAGDLLEPGESFWISKEEDGTVRVRAGGAALVGARTISSLRDENPELYGRLLTYEGWLDKGHGCGLGCAGLILFLLFALGLEVGFIQSLVEPGPMQEWLHRLARPFAYIAFGIVLILVWSQWQAHLIRQAYASIRGDLRRDIQEADLDWHTLLARLEGDEGFDNLIEHMKTDRRDRHDEW